MADGPEDGPEARSERPSEVKLMIDSRLNANNATANEERGPVTAFGGYGNRTFSASGCSPFNSQACHSFNTGIYTWDSWWPPSDHMRVESGVSRPRWYGSTPWNPYLIQLHTTFSCSGQFVNISVPPSWSSFGTSATYYNPPVYNIWNPDFYYPYNVFSCSGFQLSSVQQSDQAYVQLYSNTSAILIALSDSEGVGAF